MTEESKRVLEMLAAGRINTDQADRLLNALRDGPATAAASEARTAIPAGDGRFK